MSGTDVNAGHDAPSVGVHFSIAHEVSLFLAHDLALFVLHPGSVLPLGQAALPATR